MQTSTSRLEADAPDLTDSSRSDSSNEEGKRPAYTRLANAPVIFTVNLADC